MASIEKIEGAGGATYRITVSCGYRSDGVKVRRRTTFKPSPDMTPKQADKAAAKAAVEFERSITLGYQPDTRQTFEEYAEYVLDLNLRSGLKPRTYERYKDLLKGINQGIGQIKITDLRPQHLDMLYKHLSESGVRRSAYLATAKADVRQLLKSKKLSMTALAKTAGVSASTVSAACRGQSITADNAAKIAAALGMKTSGLFRLRKNNSPLSSKTILEYHRLIRTILAYAEKQMLVPYNAAAKATPPKVARKEINYFQPQEIVAILEALEAEPIKWRTITHLLIVTGCRRGEIMGLKWEKVDMDSRRIRIDRALLYSKENGTYESTTKTGETRFLTIPAETALLLRKYRVWQIEQRLAAGDRWQDTGYLFTRDDGTPCEPDTITAWLGDFSRRHNLKHINPHAFRHTVASVLIANGTDVVTVSKQLGHASVTTTENFYSHIIEENKSKAAECIADVLLRGKASAG
jgi:integrase